MRNVPKWLDILQDFLSVYDHIGRYASKGLDKNAYIHSKPSLCESHNKMYFLIVTNTYFFLQRNQASHFIRKVYKYLIVGLKW